MLAIYDSSSGQGFINKPPFVGATAVARDGRLSDPWLTSQNPTYSAVPFPFTDQDPANFSWPSQVTGILGMDPDYSIGSSWQWNVAVEREILKGVRLELGYQGNRTNNEPIGIPSNTAEFRVGATSEASNIQARRPNQFLGDVGWVLENAGRARYDQILLIAHVRRSSLFGQLSWAYTHSRRNFNGTLQQNNRDWDGGINPPDYPNLLIDFQNNHTVSGFVVWNLPLLQNNKNVLGKILGGWSITADGYITFLNKGTSVFTGYDTNANGNGFDLAEKTGSVSYPKTDLTGQQDLICQWFDGSAYGLPGGVASGEFTGVTASSGANSLATPGAWMVNSALLKNFGLTENAKLQIRFEVYNLLNHANLNAPNTAVNSADFGRIRGKFGAGRRIQLGARLQF